MNISYKYHSDDWHSLKLTNTSQLDDWKKAIAIFDIRYQYRYIKQINALQFNKTKIIANNSGFLIMAINCLLIETLNQYYYGKKNSEEIKSDKNISNIKSNKDCFVDFFTKSTFFNSEFNIEISEIFYEDIRCGLLHQAESKHLSKIHINQSQKSMLKLIINNNKKSLSIRRDLFTNKLFQEYNGYKAKLLSEPPELKLRTNFINKLNSICNEFH
jgi:hypothetical protein